MVLSFSSLRLFQKAIILTQRSHLAQYYVNTQTESLTVAVSLKRMTLVSPYTMCEHLHISFASLYYHIQ